MKFSTGETQKDSFAIHVLPPAPPVKPAAKIALLDPKGETGKLLEAPGSEVPDASTPTPICPATTS